MNIYRPELNDLVISLKENAKEAASQILPLSTRIGQLSQADGLNFNDYLLHMGR